MPSRSALDALLTFVGCYLTSFAPVAHVVNAVPALDSATTPGAATALVAACLATGYWHARFDLGDLGAFVFAVTALYLGLGLLVMVALGAFDAAPVTGTPPSVALDLGFTAVVYAVAYVHVYRDWRPRGRASVA